MSWSLAVTKLCLPAVSTALCSVLCSPVCKKTVKYCMTQIQPSTAEEGGDKYLPPA